MLEALWVSTGIIFVAELGDKSQLMAAAFASRYRPWPVLAGIALAASLVMGLSVAVGASVAGQLPTNVINIAAGAAFIGFAGWTLREEDTADEEAAPTRRSGRSALMTTAVAFFVAELGDKTMLATITLAARYEAIGTWAGASIGMVAADAIAIVVGAQLGSRFPERTVRFVAAGLFLAFGVLLIIEGARG